MIGGALLAGCANRPPSRGIPAIGLPGRLLPDTIDGLRVTPETSGDTAFTQAPKTSMVARGQLMTLRADGQVQGVLEVAQLKLGLRNDDERVKAGIRASIETGRYRWFKADGTQWVGVQVQPQLFIYLWFPARTDEFEILQARSMLADPDGLAADIVKYQGEQ